MRVRTLSDSVGIRYTWASSTLEAESVGCRVPSEGGTPTKSIVELTLLDPIVTARASPSSLNDQTHSHKQVKNHHNFRIAPVVMDYAAGHEAKQTAQCSEDNSFFHP